MRHHPRDPSLGAEFPDISESAFVDYPTDLHASFGRWINEKQVTAPEVSAADAAVEKITWDVAPHDVEALHDSVLRERGALANDRRPAVACDHEIAAKIARAGAVVGTDSNNA